MIKYSSSGTKVDVVFEFQTLRLGIKFPCEIVVCVATNYQESSTEPVPFDLEKPETLINKKLKTTVVLFPIGNEPVRIGVLIKRVPVDKNAGHVNLDVFSAINSRQFQFSKALERCPDHKAQLSFKFSYLNVRNDAGQEATPSTTRLTTAPPRTSLGSFYSANNNPLDTSNSSRNNFREQNSMLQLAQKGRSQSPSNVRLVFNSKGDRQNVSYQSALRPANQSIEPVRTNLRTGGAVLSASKATAAPLDPLRLAGPNGSSPLPPHPRNVFYDNEQSPTRAANPLSSLRRPAPQSPIANMFEAPNLRPLPSAPEESRLLSTAAASDVRKSIEFKPRNFASNALPRNLAPSDSASTKGKQSGNVSGNVAIDFEEPRPDPRTEELLLKVDELHKALAEKNGEIEELGRQLSERDEAAAKTAKEMASRIDEFGQTAKHHESLIAELKAENEKLKETLMEANSRRVNADRLLEFETELKELRRKNNIIEEELSGKDERIAELKRRISDLESGALNQTEADQRIAGLQTALLDARQQTAELTLAKTKESRLKDEEIAELKAEVARLQSVDVEGLRAEAARVSELELTVTDLSRQLQAIQDDAKTAKTELLLAKKEATLKSEELRGLKDEHRKEVRALQDRLEQAGRQSAGMGESVQLNLERFNIEKSRQEQLAAEEKPDGQRLAAENADLRQRLSEQTTGAEQLARDKAALEKKTVALQAELVELQNRLLKEELNVSKANETLTAERANNERLKKEGEARVALLRSEVDQKAQAVNELSGRLRQAEELGNSRLERGDGGRAEALGREVRELSDRLAEVEAEKLQLRTDYEQMVAGLNDEMARLKADAAKRRTASGINNSLMDQDDLTILMVENENLKKKIKILENETSKNNATEKSFKKNQEREAEVAQLREKAAALERQLVS